MKLLWTFLLSIIVLCSLSSFAQETNQGGKKRSKQRKEGDDGEESDGFNDYEVYEAMESMRQLTEHDNFYDLMGVKASATDDQIGKAFRKLSVKYHPDKHGPGTMKMFKLVQYVSTLLREKKRRARYDWILHEAPAWHRESVYAAKRMATAAKISLRQALLFTFLLALIGQLVVQWMAFFIHYGRIQASRQALKAMGEKEVKRIRKKLEAGDSAFMAANNSDYETVLLADSPRPHIPTPLDLFIFAIPIGIVRRLLPAGKAEEEKQE